MPLGSRSRTGVALGALSVACFVSVTSENLPVALLPALAAGFGVPDSAVGLLMTGYAVVVAVTVVPLVALTARWDRRTTALVTVAAVVASNLLLAVAPGYGVAVVARVVSAVGHGVFWSVVAPMAARLLGPGRAGRATTVVFAGNSLAFLLGLPLSSWLGAVIGWRPTVLAVAGVAALAAVAI
ncbi:MFS transporter, partial [Actinosynnema sp. NPDC023658]|uniref:MFS transporter n=1 Tax=Actinosynnema sp. NPDC023658 TaxID=3155465 RepID=UPI0033E3C0DF